MQASRSLVHRVADWAAEKPDAKALLAKVAGEWRSWTWADYHADLRAVAKGLMVRGHQPGECVALLGDNRAEWVLCELGIMAARGIPAPIYTTNTDEQTRFIVDHSEARVVICDKQEQLEKLLRCLPAGGRVTTLVTMDDLPNADARVISLSTLMEEGRAARDAPLDARIDAITDTETALLIYTSGTTGTPKAVQLDHGQMMGVAAAIMARMPPLAQPGGYRVVSYLPLCHVAEQIFTAFFHLHSGGEVAFCPSMTQLKDYLVEVRPTLFLGVPRVWEKFQAALEARLSSGSALSRKLAAWALATELSAFRAEQASGRPVSTLSRRIANALVIDKIKRGLGLDQLVAAATGAAPIRQGTLEFFASLGVIIYEAYGMSETTGVATCSHLGRPVFGSVGEPLEGVQLSIAADGEILLKGRTMTRGYLRQPDLTAELIDAEGWLHTGDLGAVDPTGNLRITGRKKDILITAGGKNVAPARMEALIQAIPGVGQVVVVGDRQPYLAALITVDPEALDSLKAKLGSAAPTVAALGREPAFLAWLQQRIDAACNDQVARYETIKRFAVLPTDFSVEGGELTPTLKLKRDVIAEKYAQDIAGLYAR